MADNFLKSGASRSELLAALMDKQNRRYSQEQNPYSIGEAFTRTGSRLVDAYMQKKLMDEELERRKGQQSTDMAALKAYALGQQGIEGQAAVPASGAALWQNPDFDPNAVGGAQQVTSIDPARQGKILGMGIDPTQQMVGGDYIPAQEEIMAQAQIDPQSQEALRLAFKQNPNMSPEAANNLVTMYANERRNGMGNTAATQTFRYYQNVLNDPDSTEEEKRGASVALGLDARAGRDQIVMIGNVPHRFDPNVGAMMPVQVNGQIVTAERVGEDAGVVAQSTAAGRTRGEGQANRVDNTINLGIDAAQGLPLLRRTIGLLDTVETGGLAEAQLRASQYFGVEGADEGELSANLGRAVLSQLKTIFGAQFTEKEGDRLEGYSAGFGRSAAANRRILRQTLTLTEGAVRRALEAALESGDEAAVQQLMDFQDGIYDLTDKALSGVFNPAQPNSNIIKLDKNGNPIQ